MSTHHVPEHSFSISPTNASSDRPRNKKKKWKRQVLLFKFVALQLLSVCRESMLWETQTMKEKARKNAGSVQCAGWHWRSSHGVVERTASHHASLTLMRSTAPLVPSRSDGSHSLQAWPAMRSSASVSPIQLLLHLSSPFRAGFRAEVVDAWEYKAYCLAVLGARNFFHFQIEISPRRARQSLSYFVNRQSR